MFFHSIYYTDSFGHLYRDMYICVCVCVLVSFGVTFCVLYARRVYFVYSFIDGAICKLYSIIFFYMIFYCENIMYID